MQIGDDVYWECKGKENEYVTHFVWPFFIPSTGRAHFIFFRLAVDFIFHLSEAVWRLKKVHISFSFEYYFTVHANPVAYKVVWKHNVSCFLLYNIHVSFSKIFALLFSVLLYVVI